jgi:hypothetical protein
MTSKQDENGNLFKRLVSLQKKNIELQELNSSLFVEKVQLRILNQLLIEENSLLWAEECDLRLKILNEKNRLRNSQSNN